MLTLIQNITCYAPQFMGVCDVLLAADKIAGIGKPGASPAAPILDDVIDGSGFIAFPGLIDQHVHITGGGGEAGFSSKLEELKAEALLSAGITTVAGLLGADASTRSIENLFAKAKALELQGLTTYIYTGSYGLPPVTLTGSLRRDMVFVDKVIGAGEIAVSDHRSSNPDAAALIGIASEIHLGGLLSDKAGIMHLHIGDGKAGLGPLLACLEASDLPPDMFVPTHVNRNPTLFRQAVDYCRSGGNIDLTAGEECGVAVSEAIKGLVKELPDLSRVTVSSDAGGSIPSGGVAMPSALFDDFAAILKQSVLPPEQAAALFSLNTAGRLKLYPQKGALKLGSDADILVTDRDYQIRMVFSRGLLLLDRR